MKFNGTLRQKFNVSGKEVELAALAADIVPERYVRNMKSYTIEDQAVLLKSTVAVVGLGGLGGGVTEILARSGVGTLKLIDGDSFEDSNLNRQFLSSQTLLTTPKAEAAVQRVKEINSSIEVYHFHEFLSEESGARLLDESDVVVDCLDSVYIRQILEKTAKFLQIPMVSAAVGGSAGGSLAQRCRGIPRLSPPGGDDALIHRMFRSAQNSAQRRGGCKK